MPTKFEFATAVRIIFGAGTLAEVGPIAAAMGRRALIVAFGMPERTAALLKVLAGIDCAVFNVEGEPKVSAALAGVQRAKAHAADLVIGFGGGSVLDTGKAIAALFTNGGDPLDYLEVIGKGKPLTQTPLPYIAIPTTAGTGSEVTRNAVLASPEQAVKVSLRSPMMLPRLALIDPELTYDLPPAVTASTGLDALTQVIEPLVSNRANPMTDALCREAIPRAARSLQRAYEQGRDPAAREDMCMVSLCGGLALANAGLGAVHGFAAPLGGMFPAPHGAVCARLLPYVMALNVRALAARQPASASLPRYTEVARLLTGSPNATSTDGVTWVRQLCETLHVPPLSTYGITKADFPALIEKAAAASSMKANPIKLTPEELGEILEQAW
jgi:alcohol dehydrogenase class IV